MVIREERITENIRHLLSDLEGKPVLALFGAGHAQKQGDGSLPTTPWAERLSEDGVEIYSLHATGLYGTAFWRGTTFLPGIRTEAFLFLPPDGISLAAVLADVSDYEIIYIDSQEASNLIFPRGQHASELYDGMLFFREVSPMVDECP